MKRHKHDLKHGYYVQIWAWLGPVYPGVEFCDRRSHLVLTYH